MAGARDAASKLVVVVDDDRLVLDAMSGLLRSWRFTVVTGASERAATELLAAHDRPPDVIICDYRLAPGTTGLDVIDSLRGGSGIPAFLITAEASSELMREGEARDVRVLAKPVAPELLRGLLRDVFKKRPRA
jgi:CheY-like chemotaxis protein